MNNEELLFPGHPLQCRKKWPIFRKTEIPKHVRWIVSRYGHQMNLSSLCEVQRHLCGSETYWKYIECPWIYMLSSKEVLYQRIISEIDKK